MPPAKQIRKGSKKAKEAGIDLDSVAVEYVSEIMLLENFTDANLHGYSWDKDDYKLSLCLMTAITDDKIIKDALFLKVGPHPSSKSGGGKPKTDHYWEICKLLFMDHPKHGPAFAIALEGGKRECGLWTTKIKNWLTQYILLLST